MAVISVWLCPFWKAWNPDKEALKPVYSLDSSAVQEHVAISDDLGEYFSASWKI